MVSPISAGGLVLDVAGALALASAFAFASAKDIRQESQTPFGGYANSYLVVARARQTADAQVGGVLLVLGFVAQFADNVGASASWLCLWVTLPASIVIALVGAGLLVWVVRPFTVRRSIEHQLVVLRDDGHVDYWRQFISNFGDVLGDELQANEAPADLALRLLGPKRWRRVSQGADLPDEVLRP
jgi:hypothetical protein